MSVKVIVATKNQGKIREIKSIFNFDNWEILTMKEEGLDPEIVEDGKTFEENSLIKVRTVREEYLKQKPQDYVNYDKVYIFADDSGLEVDALNKEPGVLSARYMGEDTSYHIKNQAIIDRLEGVKEEDRTARFVCSIAAIDMEGNETVVRETMEGYIGYKEAGENGFGYDPIFMLPEYGCTSSEISMEEKNKISHRGKALRKMMEVLLNKTDK
ncbi:MAG: RdgB/HAM1 family non-canonical purine NTP pyrophosphatase [Lachnospiraceae bacterium]|nr:RdgB/HAM1 family non-canonical purine NTP pyrophosphatase [Lachnospiraceae bacterium]